MTQPQWLASSTGQDGNSVYSPGPRTGVVLRQGTGAQGAQRAAAERKRPVLRDVQAPVVWKEVRAARRQRVAPRRRLCITKVFSFFAAPSVQNANVQFFQLPLPSD